MFARRGSPSKPAAATASGPRFAAPSLPGALANPFVSAGGAAALFALSGAVLVLVAGDPHAGAPQVKVALEQLAGDARAALKPALPAGGAMSDQLMPAQESLLPGAPIPSSGEAVVTLPQGGSVSGATSVGAAPSPARPAVEPLAPAPIAGLTQPGPGGLLPIIGKGGRTPFQAYARPFQANGKPKVALIVGGLGLNAAATKAAIERLPPEITLAFVPYAEGLQKWVDLARANGHEVTLDIPMEPIDYPNNDPGPYTLMADAQPGETMRRLEWLLARTSGYFAVTNYLGGRFVTSDSAMGAFLGALRARGLGFIDDGSAARRGLAGVPRASADSVIDEQLSGEAIQRQLLALEAQALQRGGALGEGFAYPITLEEVIRWAQGLPGRGYQLAPASAMTRR